MRFDFDNGTHIKASNNTSLMMKNLLIALLPIIFFTFYKNGVLPFINGKTDLVGMLKPILLVLNGCFTCILVESLYAKFILKYKNISDIYNYVIHSYAIFPGIFLALILPVNTLCRFMFIGTLFSVLVGKLLFGGFGFNIFNPALLGRLFLIFSYGTLVANSNLYFNPLEIDSITSSTPLSNLSNNFIGSYDLLVRPYGSLFDFFFGFIPGSSGETSAFLCILAFIFLTYKKVIKYKITIFYVLSVFLLTFFVGVSNGLSIWYPLFHIFSGGLLFGAVFMATDPVTSPVTKWGQIIYGFLLGVLTVIFRFLSPYPEGVLISILTFNMLVIIIDKIGVKISFKKSLKYIVATLFILILILLPIGINKKINFKDDIQNKGNFKIINSERKSNSIIYKVKDKGFSGFIEAEIEVNFNNLIINYNVIDSSNESYYQKIVDSNYLELLVNNSNNLEDLDTVSGATRTSTALLNMAKKTISYHKLNEGK